MLKVSRYWLIIGAVVLLLLFINASFTTTTPLPTQSHEFASSEANGSSDLVALEKDIASPVSNINPEIVIPNPLLSAQEVAIPATVPTTLYEVVRVIDGDTIEVMYEGAKRSVRYIGVDTPETVHPSKPVECMGKEASDYNKSLVVGKQVRLETDISDTDRYGRLLRYVYVGDVMVNAKLVKEGYANVVTYPPDVKYNEHFLALKREAREGKKGLWSDVCAGYESDSTSTPPVVHANPNDNSCRIKGNISSSKEKIFHVPGCKSYEKTVINEDAGERWFCTEQEAISAGWRKALNCG